VIDTKHIFHENGNKQQLLAVISQAYYNHYHSGKGKGKGKRGFV